MEKGSIGKGFVKGAITFLMMSLAPLFIVRIMRNLRPNLQVFANLESVVLIGVLIAALTFAREIKRGESAEFIIGIIGTLFSMFYVIELFSGPAGLGVICVYYGRIAMALNLKKYVFLLLGSLCVGLLVDLIELLRSVRCGLKATN